MVEEFAAAAEPAGGHRLFLYYAMQNAHAPLQAPYAPFSPLTSRAGLSCCGAHSGAGTSSSAQTSATPSAGRCARRCCWRTRPRATSPRASAATGSGTIRSWSCQTTCDRHNFLALAGRAAQNGTLEANGKCQARTAFCDVSLCLSLASSVNTFSICRARFVDNLKRSLFRVSERRAGGSLPQRLILRGGPGRGGFG